MTGWYINYILARRAGKDIALLNCRQSDYRLDYSRYCIMTSCRSVEILAGMMRLGKDGHAKHNYACYGADLENLENLEEYKQVDYPRLDTMVHILVCRTVVQSRACISGTLEDIHHLWRQTYASFQYKLFLGILHHSDVVVVRQ